MLRPTQNQQAQQRVAIGAAGAFIGRFRQQESDRASSSVAGPVATVSAAAETTTTIENEKFRITFTNKGAQVQHWILKHYTDSSGKPLDMVQQQTPRAASGCRSRFTRTTML